MEYWKGGILEGWFLKGYYPLLILSSIHILPLPSPRRRLYEPEANIALSHHSNIPIGAKPLTC